MKQIEFDFSDIKPSVLSAVTILLIVIIMVPLAKWIVNSFAPIPGLRDLVNAV